MIDIYGIYKKIPGGSLLIPMFLVALINTIFPDLLASFGGMTTALFKTGTMAFAGIILFFTGAGIQVSTLPTVLKRCGVLTIMKFAIAMTVPAMLTGVEEYAAGLGVAGAQIGLCIIVTSIVSPFITKWVVDMWGSPKVPAKKERLAAAANGQN